MAGVKGKSGGPRPNSGRPKNTLSQRQINKIIRSVNKIAKEKKTSWSDTFAEMLFDPLAGYNEKLNAFKVFMDFTIAKRQEKDVQVTKNSAPVILPETRPDPAKLIPIKGAKK